jgi:hypothetical protein
MTEKRKNAPAISRDPGTAVRNRRVGTIEPPLPGALPDRIETILRKLWLIHGKIHHLGLIAGSSGKDKAGHRSCRRPRDAMPLLSWITLVR